MISLKVDHSSGKRTIIGIGDSNAPAVHTLARVSNESRNYGLADEARMQHRALAMRKDVEVQPLPVVEASPVGKPKKVKKISIKRGRGRGRVIEVSDNEDSDTGAEVGAANQINIMNQGITESVEDEPSNKDGELQENVESEAKQSYNRKRNQDYAGVSHLFVGGVDNLFSDDEDVVDEYVVSEHAEMAGLVTAVNNVVVDDAYYLMKGEDELEMTEVKVDEKKMNEFGLPEDNYYMAPPSYDLYKATQKAALALTSTKIKKGSAKTNGYCLFIRHIAKESGTTGSINELMRKFDKDWKMLPDEEKGKWKLRAKSSGNSHRGRGGTSGGGRGRIVSQQQQQQQSNDNQQDVDGDDEDDGY